MEHKLTLVGGGKPLSGKTILTSDALHAIAPFNGQLAVYALATRQCVRSLKFNDTNNIDFTGLVAIREDPVDGNNIYAFVGTGKVLVINWKEKVQSPLVRTFDLTLPNKDDSILQIVKFDTSNLVVITGKDSPNPHTKTVLSYNIETLSSTVLTQVKNVIKVAVSNNSEYVALLSNQSRQKFTTVFSVKSNESSEVSFPYNNTLFTSLAVSNSGVLAIGTANGVIHLVQEGASRMLKWHIDQIKAMSFTNDSKYLLSGGLEKVVVFWQLETDKQQYLPRLNGEIVDINTQTSAHHNISLKLDSQDNHEVLVLSAVDLQSRLLIAGPRQLLHTAADNLKKVDKSFLKKKVQDPLKIKYDFTSVFRVHPTSKQLYFLNGLFLQIYDVYKNEQVSVLKVSSSLSTGKVRSELKLKDSIVKDFVFSADGEWLITMEEFHHGEVDDLLSKKDYTYTLKFWKSTITQSKNQQATTWELITKIINPHGAGVPVLSMIPAPKSYYKGLGVLTADNNGGVRMWRPNTNSVNSSVSWSLRKLKSSTGLVSNSVSLAWSPDSSLIFLGVDYSIVVLDTDTFDELENEVTEKLAHIAGSTIKSIDIVDNHLIILSKSIFKSIDLLSLKETDLNLKINSPRSGASHQIAINQDSNLIALIQNYYDLDSKSTIAKILIFSPSSRQPIFSTSHPYYISSIKWNNEQDFFFIDINSKIGMITTSKIPTDIVSVNIATEFNYAQEIAQLLTQAEASSSVYKEESAHQVNNTDELNGNAKKLDINSFFNLFENIEGDIKLDTMFERVMQVL